MKSRITYYDETSLPSPEEEIEVIDFLFCSLEEYGDPKDYIKECIAYALKKTNSFGGLIAITRDYEINHMPIIGCIVYNRTGMKNYIPENILVYIATDKNYRGKGIGKMLIEKSLERIEGSVALHCEPHNPARRLYEKLGFSSKYIEMRLNK